MKRWISYIWPITKKVHSKVNGVLEVTWINGRKVLDTQNANYSYGTLQRILEMGLSKVAFNRVQSILLLGLGGGSIVSSLLNKMHFRGSVIGVEIDEVVIDIAEKEFQIGNSQQLKVVHDDAFEFVLRTKEQFELVIVDLFIDNTVPKQFYSKEFCDSLRLLIAERGYLLFNLGINTVRDNACDEVVRYFQEHPYFSCHLMENLEGYSLVLLAERIDSDKQIFFPENFPKIL